jgi:hypothetical protein
MRNSISFHQPCGQKAGFGAWTGGEGTVAVVFTLVSLFDLNCVGRRSVADEVSNADLLLLQKADVAALQCERQVEIGI